MSTEKKFTVVIAGAGYAGLAAARSLAREKNVRVVLINKHAYHLLQFQLHEAAVDKIDVDTLTLPMTEVLPRKRAKWSSSKRRSPGSISRPAWFSPIMATSTTID